MSSTQLNDLVGVDGTKGPYLLFLTKGKFESYASGRKYDETDWRGPGWYGLDFYVDCEGEHHWQILSVSDLLISAHIAMRIQQRMIDDITALPPVI